MNQTVAPVYEPAVSPIRAALLGVLNKLHALNLTLVLVRRLPGQG